MKSIYVGPEKSWANLYPSIPVIYKQEVVAYGLVWKNLVVPVNGNDSFLPLALQELQRERPDINWTF